MDCRRRPLTLGPGRTTQPRPSLPARLRLFQPVLPSRWRTLGGTAVPLRGSRPRRRFAAVARVQQDSGRPRPHGATPRRSATGHRAPRPTVPKSTSSTSRRMSPARFTVRLPPLTKLSRANDTSTESSRPFWPQGLQTELFVRSSRDPSGAIVKVARDIHRTWSSWRLTDIRGGKTWCSGRQLMLYVTIWRSRFWLLVTDPAF